MTHKATPKRGTDAAVTLTRKRSLVVNKLNKIDNFVTFFTIQDFSFVELVSRQDKLQKVYNEHEELVVALTEILSVGEFVKLQDAIEIFEDKFNLVFRKLTDAITKHEATKSSIPKLATEHQSEAVKLGLKLPKFDGDKLKWLAFKNVYIAVIHTRTDINDVVKFAFLLDSVRGKAAETIEAINLTSEGYQAAWNNLKRVYDKPKAIAQANIIGMFNLPKCKQGTAEELRALLNMVTSHLASLNALEFKTDNMSELIIINLIINCLNNNLETEWNKTVSIDEMPQLQNLILFLEKECSNIETLINIPTSNSHQVQFTKHKQQVHRGTPVRTLLTTADGKKYANQYPCNICKQAGHYSYQCDTLLKLPLKERIKRTSHLCSNCLSPVHTTTQCKSIHGCKVCGLKHNTILHQHSTSFQQGLQRSLGFRVNA